MFCEIIIKAEEIARVASSLLPGQAVEMKPVPEGASVVYAGYRGLDFVIQYETPDESPCLIELVEYQ
jgi:hypothetical protein